MKSNKDKSDEDKDGMKRVGREAKERMSSQMENRKRERTFAVPVLRFLLLELSQWHSGDTVLHRMIRLRRILRRN